MKESEKKEQPHVNGKEYVYVDEDGRKCTQTTYTDKHGKVWKVIYRHGNESIYDIAARILPRLM